MQATNIAPADDGDMVMSGSAIGGARILLGSGFAIRWQVSRCLQDDSPSD
jgi:hypothetical protein